MGFRNSQEVHVSDWPTLVPNSLELNNVLARVAVQVSATHSVAHS